MSTAVANPPQVQSRKPTGRVPWPMILVEGGEKSGKSWAFAQLTGSPRIGQSFWLDLGEGTAEEYGLVPGARFEILNHDGTYAQILTRVREVKALARWAVDNGQPPVALCIDTISDIWEGLKDWAADRARARRKKGPDEEVTVSMDLWNDSGTRYRRLMTELLTFPGIVVLLARGKEVALVEGGKPVEGKKDYRVEGHKTLAYDATAWVRLSRTGRPQVIGARSVHAGIRAGRDEPKEIKSKEADDRLLEWLIFDTLRLDPQAAQVRDYRPTTGGELTEEERGAAPAAQQAPNRGRTAPANAMQASPPDAPVVNRLAAEVKAAADLAQLREVWNKAVALEKSGELTGAGANHLGGLVKARKAELGVAAEKLLLRLRMLLAERGVTDEGEQLIVATRITQRTDLESTMALTEAEATAVIDAVQAAGPDVDLLTGGPLPPGVDPASVPLVDEGQPQPATNGQPA